jgi:hypothetical protein
LADPAGGGAVSVTRSQERRTGEWRKGIDVSAYVGCIFYVVYLAMGFVQLLAIVAGVQEWLDISWVLAGIVALFLAYIPAIGTIVGIMGAVEAWG